LLYGQHVGTPGDDHVVAPGGPPVARSVEGERSGGHSDSLIVDGDGGGPTVDAEADGDP
jgi:hypothetical protein